MSDNKDNKKKGFFARLFGGSNTSKESNNAKPTPIEKDEIPTLSSVKKMKKADIVDSAKAHGLDLDISLTKVKLIEAWELHFNSSKVNQEDVLVEEVSLEEAPAEEEEETATTEQPTLRVPVIKIDLPLPSAEVVATATYAAVAAVATTTLATPLFDKLKKQIQKFLQKKVDKWKKNRQKKKESLES